MFEHTRKLTNTTRARFWTYLICLIASILAYNVNAQISDSGIISGSVIDTEYGGIVSGALVRVVDTELVGYSDLKGRFIIRDVPAGTYNVIVTCEFYKTSLIEEVEVVAEDSTKLEIPLYSDDSDIVELGTFTTKAKVVLSSDLGLLTTRRKSPSIGDSIGAETFSRLGLGDAADAMTKVPGASVVDGQYVVVRGLSDRYNNTTLNGAAVPSADPYKKAVQLDQFPAAMIDVIATTKTATPDKPGDFTGGAINIQTKSFPDRRFLSFSTGISINENTYNEDWLTYTGGGDDWLAKDDGSRALPALVANSDNISSESDQVRDQIIRSISPEVSSRVGSGDFSHSHSISFGDSIQLGGKPFGYVASLSYKRDHSANNNTIENRYRALRVGSQGDFTLYPRRDLERDVGEQNVNIGFTLNAGYKITPEHEVGIKSFVNRSGIDEAVFVDGIFDDSDVFFIRENRLHYTERSIDSHQLYGDHKFSGLNGLQVSWKYSDSSSSQDEPDFRLFYDALGEDDIENPRPGSYFFPTGLKNWRLFRELAEDNQDFQIDFEIPIGVEGGQGRRFKAGYRKLDGNRDYFEQTFGYRTESPVPYDGVPSNYLSNENIGLDSEGNLRRVLSNETTIIPRYEGESEIEALYAMVDIAWSRKLRTVFGVRNEKTDISVNTFDSFGNVLLTGFGEISEDDLLPSGNMTWSLDEKQNIRVAYSRTLARPNYRELSPIETFTAIGGFGVSGYADLERTLIDNFDLRWEYFGDEGQLLAASIFVKELDGAIEQTFDRFGDTTYRNVDSATVEGLELEARHRIRFLSGDSYKTMIGGNFSLIDSEVTRPETELQAKQIVDPDISTVRELQGQSPYIINFDTTFEHFSSGITATLNFNKIGDRLYEVSQAQLPDVQESTGESLDLILSKRFGEKMKLKFKIGNILDSENVRYHEFMGESFIYTQSYSGRTYSLSFSYDFL